MMTAIPSEWLKELSSLREELQCGENADQRRLDKLSECWRERRHPIIEREKDEAFDLVDSQGKLNGLWAERWLCHLLGLRHRCSHVLLRWTGSSLGNVLIFQVRAWDKSDSRGHLDITVGGHVTRGEECATPIDTAEVEMKQELGIRKSDLIGGELLACGGYPSYNDRPEGDFFNAEWREVYVADIATKGFVKIDFADKEVIGLLLCPEPEARNFLDPQKNKYLGVASGLRGSLDLCLRYLENHSALGSSAAEPS